jgi:apolipoprotein N-acyltransferase
VPFGERIPFEDDIPFFRDWIAKLEMGEGNWSPGSGIQLFELSGTLANDPGKTTRLAAVICFESIFPEEVAAFVRKGADLLVVITNDAWFGRPYVPFWLSGGMYQHAQIAVFRAIENRLSIARCANNGITMTIDAYGRVLKRAPLFEQAVLTDVLSLRQETTFFTRHGHVFVHAISMVAIALVGVAALEPRRRARSGRGQPPITVKHKSPVSRS